MMPDNKEPSDTAGDEPANDTAGDETTSDTGNKPADAPAEASSDQLSEEAQHDDSLDFIDQAEDQTEAEPLDELTVVRNQLAEAELKANDHWDRVLRLQAEMENQRKRAHNDVTKARKFALEGIVNDLLPIKDSLEMGLAAATSDDADASAIVEGAELTLKMLAQVFEKNNIVELNPVDEKFDPEFHQAMSMQEIEGKSANTVASVMQKGYTLNDRLVRPALVMVAK